MIEFLRTKLAVTQDLLQKLNQTLEKGGHRLTLEQAKIVYDKIKELEGVERDLKARISALETEALKAALNPENPLVEPKKPVGENGGPLLN